MQGSPRLPGPWLVLFLTLALGGGAPRAQELCGTAPLVEGLGGGSAGAAGVPSIALSGEPLVNFPLSFRIEGGLAGSFGFLLLSPLQSPLPLPGFGATFHPALPFLQQSFFLDGSGGSPPLLMVSSLGANFCGKELYAQAVVVDLAAPGGIAFSDGVRVVFGGKDLSGPPPGAPVPAPPALDPHPAVTDQPSITLTGAAPGALVIEVQGPAGLAAAPVTAGLFSVEVLLLANQKNALFLTAISDLGAESAPAGTSVVRDGSPPALFIDFPAAGALLTTPTVDVAGRVSDALSGFMGLTVTVNGVAAAVDVGIGTNGTYFAPAVPLNPGAVTDLVVQAQDAFGNTTVKQVSVSQADASGASMAVTAGNAQSGAVGTELASPIEVQVLQAGGAPFAGKTVTFAVTKSDGVLAASPGGAGVQELQLKTDSQGFARAHWRLGSDAGCGNNRAQATSTDISGSVFFCASATPSPAAQIAAGDGSLRMGEVDGPLPEPLVVWVSDGQNGVAGVTVSYTVVQGGGLVDGQASAMAVTDATGHAEVDWTLGPAVGLQRVEASFAGLSGLPVTFSAQGLVRDETAPTSFAGRVLDNALQPVGGAACSLTVGGVQLSATSGADGRFLFSDTLAAGPGHLRVDGLVATQLEGQPIAPGSFPSLEFEVVLVPNAANALPRAVLLPPLNPENAVLYSLSEDTVLTVAEIEGLEMTIAAGSMSVDGQPAAEGSVVSLNQVHFDDIPMPFPDGAGPPFAWTLQPAGAEFDPPVTVSMPNFTGLEPGAVMYFLSFDHDTERFEIVASGSVTAGGDRMVSDPGAGLAKAGWGGFCPPYPVTGNVELNSLDDAKDVLDADYASKLGSAGAGLAHQILCIAQQSCGVGGGKPPWSGEFIELVFIDIASNVLNPSAVEQSSVFPFAEAICDKLPPWIPIPPPPGVPPPFPPITSGDVCMVLGGTAHFLFDLRPSFNKHIPALKAKGVDVASQHEGFFSNAVVPCFDQVHASGEMSFWAKEIAQALVPVVATHLRDTACALGLHVQPSVPGGGDSPAPAPAGGGGFPVLPPAPTQAQLFSDAVDGVGTLEVSAPGGAFFLSVGSQLQLTVTDAQQVDLTSAASGTLYFAVVPDDSITITGDGLLSINATRNALVNDPLLLYVVVRNADEWGIGQFAVMDQDSDGDLVVDSYELAAGLDPLVTNPLGSDVDGDGLPDLGECVELTQPTVFDSDGDGVGDGEELVQGSNPLDPTSFEAGLDEDFEVTVSGVSAPAGSGGSFSILCVPAGPNLTRAHALGDSLGSDFFGASEYFEVVEDQTHFVQLFEVRDTPFPLPVSIDLQIDPVPLVAMGESRQVTTVAEMSDGTTVDVTPRSAGTNYFSSDFSVVGVSLDGLLTANGDGIAYITAVNEGAVSTRAVLSLLGSEVTTVEGFVQEEDGTPVAGAEVRLSLLDQTDTTDAAGFFSIDTVPATLGELNVTAVVDLGGQVLSGAVVGLAPVPGGITDAGILVVSDSVFWVPSTDGAWTDGANWSTGAVPGPDDNAVLDRTGGLTITLGAGVQAVRSLFCNETLQVAGDLSVAEIARVGGTLFVQSGGSVTGGVLQTAGPVVLDGGSLVGLQVDPGALDVGVTVGSSDTGTLDGVTLNAGLTLLSRARLTVQNGLVLNGEIALASTDFSTIESLLTRLDFSGPQTLSGSGDVVFESIGTANRLRPTGGALTIGPDVTVRGRAGTVGRSNEVLVNQGVIRAEVPGQTITVTGDGWSSLGTLEAVLDGNLTLTGTSWVNQGTARVTGGGDLRLAGSWVNQGLVTMTSSNVYLGGNFTLMTLGAFSTNGGSVFVTGTLDNSGGTLALDSSTGSWNLDGGTILGGTVTGSGGAGLDLAFSDSGTLDGVTLDADVDLANRARLTVLNGLELNGAITLNSTEFSTLDSLLTRLDFSGPQTLQGSGEVVIVGSGNGNRVRPTGGALTIAPGITVRGRAGTVGRAGESLVNQGVIRAEASNQTLTVTGTAWTNEATIEAVQDGNLTLTGTGWVNDGTVSITGGGNLTLTGSWVNQGTLAMTSSNVFLGGTFTMMSLGTFNYAGGSVSIIGTLDNTGETLALSSSTGSWKLDGGTVLGGTVTGADGEGLSVDFSDSGTLDGVVLDAGVNLASRARLTVLNGLELNGTITLNSADFSTLDSLLTRLDFSGPQTLQGTGEVVFAGSGNGNRVRPTGGALTVSPGITIRGRAGTVGRSSEMLVNLSLIHI